MMSEKEELDYEMEASYDFSKGRRGAYADRPRDFPSSLIMIAPELLLQFPTSEAVNEGLRTLLKLQERDAA